jgi:hypothetical protein
MKKILIALSAVILFAACVDKDEVATIGDAQRVNLTNAITTKDYSISTKPGMFTIVYTADGMLIAIDSVSQPITVPKGVEIKTAYAQANQVNEVLNSLNINQTNGNENNSFDGTGTYQLWQTIAFEDMLVGDNDYNDLVIHCKYQMKNKQLRIGIHPVALGGSLRIALGCDIYKGTTFVKEVMIADNCRRDLFDNQQGFLNTQTFNFKTEETDGHKMTKVVKYVFSNDEFSNSGAVTVNWFILVYDASGTTVVNRFNALSTRYIDNNMLDANSSPYGIITTYTGKHDSDYGLSNGNTGHDWFNYPLEKEKIYNAYTSWSNWLKTTGVDFVTMYGAGYQSDKVFHAGQQGLFVIKSGFVDTFASWATNYLIDGNTQGTITPYYPTKK